MNMIPNPRKNITVDFTIGELKSALTKIPAYFSNKYTLDKRNDLLNQFTFGALEFLSLGVFIDINLNFITEIKTDITIEVRRKLGAFDQWHEVQKANQHIDALFNGIAALLAKVRQENMQNAMAVDVENPSQSVKYDLPWNAIIKHVGNFVASFPETYSISKQSKDEIILRRMPQIGDDVYLAIDAILKISPIFSDNSSSELKFEISNDKGKITTQGELNRNKLILTITINILQRQINELKKKIIQAEAKLDYLKKWQFGRSEAEKEKQLNGQSKVIEELKMQLIS